MEAHLFTGGKGGTGKTLIALCIAAHFLNLGQKALIIDLNTFNPDLYSILEKLKKTAKIKCEEDFDLVHLKNDGLLVAPTVSKPIHYQLPQGVQGFYRDYLNKVLGLPTVKEYDARICLIDTGYHIANLALADDKLVAPSTWLDKENSQNHLQDVHLHIWFMWTLQTIQRDYERKFISKAIKQIPSITGCKKFDPDKNVHHVFNPYNVYNIYPESRFAQLIAKTLGITDHLNVMVENAHRPPSSAINFDALMKEISEDIRHHSNFSSQLKPEKYVDIVCRVIYEKNNHYNRPKNFYPVLKYPELLNYTSHLISRQEDMDLGYLQSYLGQAGNVMTKYLEHTIS